MFVGLWLGLRYYLSVFSFLSRGLKYHDIIVMVSTIIARTAPTNGCSTVRYEINAPDIAKKKTVSYIGELI